MPNTTDTIIRITARTHSHRTQDRLLRIRTNIVSVRHHGNTGIGYIITIIRIINERFAVRTILKALWITYGECSDTNFKKEIGGAASCKQ